MRHHSLHGEFRQGPFCLSHCILAKFAAEIIGFYIPCFLSLFRFGVFPQAQSSHTFIRAKYDRVELWSSDVMTISILFILFY